MKDDIRDHFSKLSDQQKSHYDNVSMELAPLMTNQYVRIYYPDKTQWYIGKILSRERDISYKVMSSNSAILIRNRIHLRPILCHQTMHHMKTHLNPLINTTHHRIIKPHPIRLIQNHTHNLVCSQHQMLHNIVHVMVVLLDHQYDIPLSTCVKRYTKQA